MPRATALNSGKGDSDVSSITQILTLFDKKIRNIEKRKKHLEELRASGEDQSLTEQQREALSKYDEVCANQQFALELRERCVELVRETTLRKRANRQLKVDCATQTDALHVENKCEQADTSAHVELDALHMQHAFELFRVSQQQQQQQLLASATNQLILDALGPPHRLSIGLGLGAPQSITGTSSFDTNSVVDRSHELASQPLLHSSLQQDGLAAGSVSPADSKVAAVRPLGMMVFPSAEEALRAAGLTPSGNFTFLQPDPITIDAGPGLSPGGGPGLGFNPTPGSGPSTLLSCGPRAVMSSVSGPSSGIGVIGNPLSGSEPVTGRGDDLSLAPALTPASGLGAGSGLVSLAAQELKAAGSERAHIPVHNDGPTDRPQRIQRGRGRAKFNRTRGNDTQKHAAVESWLESVAVANRGPRSATIMSGRSPVGAPALQQSTTTRMPLAAEMKATIDSEWD